jgi:hypothetical protein
MINFNLIERKKDVFYEEEENKVGFFQIKY